MKWLCVLLCALFMGCGGHQQPVHRGADAIIQYKRGTAFYLTYCGKRYLVTAGHLIAEVNTNYRDVHVVPVAGEGPSLEPSFVNVPMRLLPDEMGRSRWKAHIIGFVEDMRVKTRGLVCGRVVRDDFDLIYTTVPMKHGMSGSPVMNSEGKVIGIAVQIRSGKGRAKSACTPIAWALAKVR